MRQAFLLGIVLATCVGAHAQWEMQNSHTTADLRGIHSVGGGVAWASGTNGTVLRTEDGGFLWQVCAVPPGAENLDFRGIQAFDENTAIVMSSGKGDLSRLYKTTDGCNSWKQVFVNPYSPDGFFDAMLFLDARRGILLGDPSPASWTHPLEKAGYFRVRVTHDGGETWGPVTSPDVKPGNGLHALGDESAFAASNSSIASFGGWFWLGTSASRVTSRRLYPSDAIPEYLFRVGVIMGTPDPISGQAGQSWHDFHDAAVPISHSSLSAGIFSLSFRDSEAGIAVGGDYKKPDEAKDTAAWTKDKGLHWTASSKMPHGYRSAVAYDVENKTWITVGPNGTDTDDGRNWRAVHPNPALHESPDADKNWNALSLPFVVGPHGRIGKLHEQALSRQATHQ
jgi:hypothetical protein